MNPLVLIVVTVATIAYARPAPGVGMLLAFVMLLHIRVNDVERKLDRALEARSKE